MGAILLICCRVRTTLNVLSKNIKNIKFFQNFFLAFTVEKKKKFLQGQVLKIITMKSVHGP